MAEITPLIQEYMLDFASNNNFFYVNGVQGDGHSVRYVRISLMNNGQPYYINANNVNIAVRGTTSNGEQYLDLETPTVINNSTIQIELTQNMLMYPGKGVYEVCIMKKNSNQILTSFPFYVITSKSGFDTKGITQTNEFINLVNVLSTVNGIVNECQNIVANCESMLEEYNELDAKYTVNNAKENGDYAREQGTYAEEWGKKAEQAIADIQDAIGINDSKISKTAGWSSQYIKEQLDRHLYYFVDGSVDVDIPEVLSAGDENGNVTIVSDEILVGNDNQGNATIASTNLTSGYDNNGNVTIVTY